MKKGGVPMGPSPSTRATPARIPLRWVAIGVFILASTLNFLDRQLLAALAPTLKSEFHLSNTQYGGLVSAFHLVYALAAPFSGLFVDRLGLNLGASVAIIVWSLAAAATGLTQTLRGLMACRMGLGLGESAGIPSAAKAGATYLEPAELGLSGGLGSASVHLGSIAAPLIAAVMAPRYGWRSVFILCGLLGMLWVPLWLFTSRHIPPQTGARMPPRTPARELLRNRQLWAVALAFGLVLTLYTLWSNWTTIYLVQERHLTQLEANQRFAWLPPVFAVLGAFLGGALTFHWIRGGMGALAARLRACWFTAPLLLVGAAIPFLPSATLAALAIGISILSFQNILNNITVMPIDLFGARPAAFTNSVLISVGAVTQALVSPVIGSAVDRFGFTAVCIAAPVLPLLGLWLLHVSVAKGSS
jgi:ACS family hexuronate transporter-like MFS transporter